MKTDATGNGHASERSRGSAAKAAPARSHWIGIALALGLLFQAGSAWAGPVPAGFSLDIQIDQGASTWTADETTIADDLDATQSGDVTNVVLMAEKTVLGGGATIQGWNSSFDPDPYITNNFVVVNNSAVTQTYTFTVSGAIAPAFLADTLFDSNIILSINDNDGSGNAMVSSVVSTPVYEAFVNTTSELTFLSDPFSNSCTSAVDCAANGTSVGAIASQAFGPVLATSMGITVSFQLSAGDAATVLSRFEIVPEPGTATLLGLGLVGAAGLRRRGLLR